MKREKDFDLGEDLADSIKVFDNWVQSSVIFLKWLWNESKIKFFGLIAFLTILYYLSSLFSTWMWGTGGVMNPLHEYHNRTVIEQIEVSEGVGTEEPSDGLKLNVQANFVLIDNILSIFKPVLDGFVSTTPDVAGSKQISFSFGQMNSAKVYSSSLMEIIFPLLVIMLGFQATQILVQAKLDRGKEEFTSLLIRLGITVLMLIFTPYILSYSIQFINALNRIILGADSISTYLNNYFDAIKSDYDFENGAFGFLGGIFNNVSNTFNPAQGLADTFQLILILAPIYLSLLIFLFLIFQFVIRFLKLYFLSVVYPFIVIFYLNKGSVIPNNYWKEWTTALIHQAGFIMGYKILNDLSSGFLESGGVGLEQFLIYIGGLLFLLSINIITAQIWGNAFSAVTDSFMAKSLGALISAPLTAGAGAVVGFGKGALSGVGDGDVSNVAGTKIRDGMMGRFNTNKEGFPVRKSSKVGGGYFGGFKSGEGNIELRDPTKSKSAQRMTEKGYSVSGVDQKEGVIGVEGKWQAVDNKSSGITTLYESKEEAKADGVKESKLYEIEGNYNMLDTVNYGGMQNYSDRTQTKILLDNTPNKRANEVLNQAKDSNIEKGIDGITTSQYSREIFEKYGKNPPEEAPRIQKSFVYTDKVKGEDNETKN